MAKYLSSRDYGSMSLATFSPSRESSPRGLHSASVHIAEISEFSNPHPEPNLSGNLRSASVSPSIEEDCMSPLVQDYLTPMKLVQLTREPDLTRLTFLELTVNTTENSLGDFGRYLPNLAELRFNNSVLPCIRDLGTSLPVVKILWMPCCTLKDLDGLSALPSIMELYLAFNKIEDISVVTMLTSLEVLDLESNDISEMDQLGYLGLCVSLKAITLEGNPLATRLLEETGSESKYRETIYKAVPSIEYLDDTSFLEERKEKQEVNAGEDGMKMLTSSVVLNDRTIEKDWHILQESIKKGTQWNTDTSLESFRPSTTPPSRSRPLSVSPTPVFTSGDESSELTHGLSQVICGNPVRALRARKQHGLKSASAVQHRPATTTPTSGYRTQDWKLDTVCEDLVITRSKSEERLFTEDAEDSWEPDHLSLSANTYQMTSSPNYSQSPPPSSMHSNVTLPSSPSLPDNAHSPTEHQHPIARHPTPPKAPAPSDSATYISNSVSSYRLRRFRKLSNEPVISDTSQSS